MRGGGAPSDAIWSASLPVQLPIASLALDRAVPHGAALRTAHEPHAIGASEAAGVALLLLPLRLVLELPEHARRRVSCAGGLQREDAVELGWADRVEEVPAAAREVETVVAAHAAARLADDAQAPPDRGLELWRRRDQPRHARDHADAR
eukprot:1187633-Rhodomonas_salina.1